MSRFLLSAGNPGFLTWQYHMYGIEEDIIGATVKANPNDRFGQMAWTIQPKTRSRHVRSRRLPVLSLA